MMERENLVAEEVDAFSYDFCWLRGWLVRALLLLPPSFFALGVVCLVLALRSHVYSQSFFLSLSLVWFLAVVFLLFGGWRRRTVVGVF